MLESIDRGNVPGAYNFGDGVYIPYREPSVDDAYVAFSIEIREGLTEQEKRIIAKIAAMQNAKKGYALITS